MLSRELSSSSIPPILLKSFILSVTVLSISVILTPVVFFASTTPSLILEETYL